MIGFGYFSPHSEQFLETWLGVCRENNRGTNPKHGNHRGVALVYSLPFLVVIAHTLDLYPALRSHIAFSEIRSCASTELSQCHRSTTVAPCHLSIPTNSIAGGSSIASITEILRILRPHCFETGDRRIRQFRNSRLTSAPRLCSGYRLTHSEFLCLLAWGTIRRWVG